MSKKVIELEILEDFEESGVSAISLVDVPAIEKTWMAFREELFVEPGADESQDEFIGRCIEYVTGEGKDVDQAAAICYSKWQEKFDIIPNPCWSGYEPIGLKPNGDPNCVPIKNAKVTEADALNYSKQQFAESYSDYPEEAKNNAKRAIKYAEENGWGSCGTPVGKIRARQLANGEAISEETIARMAAFERHRQNSDTPYGEGCGKLMWDAWGGDAGVEWAARKLQQIRKDKTELSYDVSNLPPYVDQTGQKKKFFASEDEQIVVGPAMLPNMEILRKDEDGSNYYVKFTPEVIKKIAEKFMRELRNRDTNIQHNAAQDGGSYVMETWIVENEEDKANSLYNMDVPLGTWMVKMRVHDPKTWKKIKSGELRGFSIEGNFMSKEDYAQYQKDREIYNRIIKILKSFD